MRSIRACLVAVLLVLDEMRQQDLVGAADGCHVCVLCACVRACTRVYVYVCVCVCVRARAHVRVYVGVHT